MSRKIFISFLGTGNYKPLRYKKDSFVSNQTAYIQEATLAYLDTLQPWTAEDAAYILLTEDAERVHWSNLRMDLRTKEVSPNKGLEACLKDLMLPLQIVPVKGVSSNGTEEGIWSVFKQMVELVKDGDCLYLDTTHAFRYLPMLMLVFSKYVGFLKNAEVKSITYGNFEAAVDGVGPIVDLMPLSALQDWSFAAGQYIKNGITKDLLDLSNEVLNPICKNNAQDRTNANALRGYVKNLHDDVENRRTCRGKELVRMSKISNMETSYAKMEDVLIEPLVPIIQHVQESVRAYKPNCIQNLFESVRWCYAMGLYQQAITLLQEGVCTFLCDKVGLDWGKVSDRECVSAAFYHLKGNKKEISWKFDSDPRYHAEKTKEIMQLDHIGELLNEWVELTRFRNSYNHGGMLSNDDIPSATMKKSIGDRIDRILPLLSQVKLPEHPTAESPNPPAPIFINLSNHPSSAWSGEQRSAAISQYGSIVDIPFPSIDPSAEDCCIKNLADEHMERIARLAEGRCPTVHIMGEMNFTFAMVKRLQEKGILCVASTTERIVEQMPDGEKKSTFKFVRFRRYE